MVRVFRELLDITGDADTLALIMFVFELIPDRVKVAEALGVLEARDTELVGDVVELFELDADFVPKTVCVDSPVLLIFPVAVKEPVSVFEKELVPVDVLIAVADLRADMLRESVGLFVDVLHEEAEGVTVRESLGVTDPLADIVDVLEDPCVLVGVVLEVGVFDGLTVRLPENVLRMVDEMREVDVIVFEVVLLPVEVVDNEEVLEDEADLDVVDDELVVLEFIAVAELVKLLKVLGVPFGLHDPLGEGLVVLEGPIDRVIVDEAVPDFDGGGDLDMVEHAVPVLEILELPVIVFVIGAVLDSLAEEVDVRDDAIV